MSFNTLSLENSFFDDFEELIQISDINHLFSEDDKCNTHFESPLNKPKKESCKANQRVKKPLEAGRLVGHWNMVEKKRYHWFLEMFHGHFQNKQMRRMDKIFKSMADFIGSRAADQCRSHHQKMEKKFHTFHKIIYNLRLSNYNTIDTFEMEQELKNNQIQIPDTLVDTNIFHFHHCSTKQNVDEKESEEYERVKIEGIGFQSEEEGNYGKRFDFMEELSNQPLI